MTHPDIIEAAKATFFEGSGISASEWDAMWSSLPAWVKAEHIGYAKSVYRLALSIEPSAMGAMGESGFRMAEIGGNWLDIFRVMQAAARKERGLE